MGSGRLEVLLGPQNRVGAEYFQVRRRGSGEHLLSGLFHAGPAPATNWVEVLDTGEALTEEGLERLFRLLAGLLPPGGHLMCEYESPARRETGRALERGVPPVLTPLGIVMLRAGLDGGFRDWYIPEGWREGPRKLQAFKALDGVHRRAQGERMAEELREFLSSPGGRRYLEEDPGARERALEAVSRLLPVVGEEALVGLGALLPGLVPPKSPPGPPAAGPRETG